LTAVINLFGKNEEKRKLSLQFQLLSAFGDTTKQTNTPMEPRKMAKKRYTKFK